jgi:hypothetical protein
LRGDILAVRVLVDTPHFSNLERGLLSSIMRCRRWKGVACMCWETGFQILSDTKFVTDSIKKIGGSIKRPG